MAACQTYKRLKKTAHSREREDKISNLPEALLCHIISLLPMKEAVRTCILGIRWRYLWANIPNLEFEYKLAHPHRDQPDGSDSKPKLNEFMDFVERALILRDGMNIRRFNLSCFEFCDFSRVYAWICSVLTCNVQELEISLSMHSYGQLPWSLLTCRTLVVLKLAGRFVLNIPTNICLMNLKILHLRSLIYWDDSSAQKLFSSCPILEDLEVVRFGWDNVWSFRVSVPSLKRLSLHFHANQKFWEYIRGCHHRLLVYAPNLEYLKLHDRLSQGIMFSKLPCLVEADIDVQGPAMSEVTYDHLGKCVLKLLDSISAAKFLSLSTHTLSILWYAHSYNIPAFQNVVRLKLGVDHFHGWDLLPSLLEKSPNLEVLRFEEGLVHVKNPRDNYHRFRSMPRKVPDCLLMHLKNIEIHQLVGKVDELRLLMYFLKNARVLQLMTIRCHCMNAIWNIQERLLMFQNALRNCPRGSSSCQVKFII